MVQATIPNLVSRRDYLELEKRADEYLENDDWSGFLHRIQHTNSAGKARDALVTLLELDAVGGTDSDIFTEFSSLEGASLHEVRLSGVRHAIELLKEQIAEKHTYFLDVEAMALTPYAILVQDVIEARKKELTQLEKNPSRIDVLGTFYGFAILMVEGSKPNENSTSTGYGWRRYRRRTWLDESITDNAANAVKSLTGQFAEEVDMDKRYRTLGSSSVFKSRCTKDTAKILADAVRLALYKVPGNRSSAARNLGRTGDSRTLPFLHHRMALEQSSRVRTSIANALGNVGHISSLDALSENVGQTHRRLTKDLEASIQAIGGIYCPESKKILKGVVEKCGNTVKAAAIQALGKQDRRGLVDLLTPYLKHKSRPVVRASVHALMDLGDGGKIVVKSNAAHILKQIGHDRPSQSAVKKVIGIPEVGQTRAVQEFYSKRIYQLRKSVESWKGRGNTGSYSYWYQRRERRETQKLREAVDMANRHLKPPFQVELLNSVKAAVMTYAGSIDIRAYLGDTELARAIIENNGYFSRKKQRNISQEQTYFG
jgi:hypothetical protein